MLTDAQLAEIWAAADRGALLADQKIPGWVDSVNPFTLNMQSMSDCVLGQAMRSRTGFGFFPRMTYEEKLYRIGLTPANQYHYGFAISGPYDENRDYREAWIALDQAWLEQIAKRDRTVIAPTTHVQVSDERPLVLV